MFKYMNINAHVPSQTCVLQSISYVIGYSNHFFPLPTGRGEYGKIRPKHFPGPPDETTHLLITICTDWPVVGSEAPPPQQAGAISRPGNAILNCKFMYNYVHYLMSYVMYMYMFTIFLHTCKTAR